MIKKVQITKSSETIVL